MVATLSHLEKQLTFTKLAVIGLYLMNTMMSHAIHNQADGSCYFIIHNTNYYFMCERDNNNNI